jgi:hypothetical protein
MKILDYNNTAINLTYLLYLKVEINKENPKKSYIKIFLNESVTMNDILIQYEDLISDEKFESMKPKVFDIKPFEPERLLELIYYWIVVFVTDEDKDKESNITYFNIKNALEELILKSFKKQGV